jgi:hypothetical protein
LVIDVLGHDLKYITVRLGAAAQAVEHLPSKLKALSQKFRKRYVS